jgi:hypothetical protein
MYIWFEKWSLQEGLQLILSRIASVVHIHIMWSKEKLIANLNILVTYHAYCLTLYARGEYDAYETLS